MHLLDPTPRTNLAHDVFASHWRALAATSPVDVVSSDRHTVKPWFAGKVAQTPPVQDFADHGFPLAGGRIDYVGDTRVPVLVYKHGQHVIDVFVLPGGTSLSSTMEQGYRLDTVSFGGQLAAVVSDMDVVEAEKLTALLRGE
jgi:anti-sigma factor RsiW